MRRSLRRILFALFVVLFFLSAGALLFYASGYRYHAGKRAIEKTGKLVVETEPSGARIALNGRLVNGRQTPLALSYLLSGEYELSIEKDGFFQVMRRITITPGVSVLVNDISLISESAPRIRAQLAGGFERAENIAAITQYDNKILAVIRTSEGWSIREDAKEIISEDAKKRQPFASFRFSEEYGDLYSASSDGIYRFDREKRLFALLVKIAGVQSFFATENALYILTDKNSIAEFRLPEGKKVREIFDIPSVQTIIGIRDGMIALKGKGDALYLFDWRGRVRVFQYMNDARELEFVSREHFFSANDFEVWEHAFSANRYTRQLVTRQSELINFIVPFQTRPFIVIVSQNGSIRLRTLAAESGGQDFSLAQFDNVRAVELDKKETFLTVVGSYNGTWGIYAISLIEEEPLFPLVK